MTISDRLNKIIQEQHLTKKEFAEKLGITENYVYILTGNSNRRPKQIAHSLAKLIAIEFGYNEQWIIEGNEPKNSN